MSAHSHVQRLQYMQQQQAMQQRHKANISSGQSTGGMTGGNDSRPQSMASYAPQPQPRYSTGTAASAGYAPYQPHPNRPGLYSAHSQGSLNSQPVSVSTFGGPRTSIGGTTRMYQQTNLKASRSLGASRASLATNKSGRSTIQQEHHDRRVRREVFSPWHGKARVPFLIAVILFTIALLLIIVGAIFIGLTAHGRMFIPVDNAVAIGPIILVIGVLFCFGGVKFVYDAYKLNAIERSRLKLRPHNASMVSINTVGSKRDEHEEKLMSGGATDKALTRTPAGSRISLSNIA